MSYYSLDSFLTLVIYSLQWGRPSSDLTLADSSEQGTELVYFNSNEYHGRRFLTNEAMEAGYSNSNFRPDASFVEKGIGSLVQKDENALTNDAEDAILRTLVRFPSTRTVIKNVIDDNDMTTA